MLAWWQKEGVVPRSARTKDYPDHNTSVAASVVARFAHPAQRDRSVQHARPLKLGADTACAAVNDSTGAPTRAGRLEASQRALART